MTTSIIRSIHTVSLLLAASMGMSLCAQAGESYAQTSKDKNPIQQPAPAVPKFYIDLAAGGEFDIHATKFISNGRADFLLPGGNSLPARIQSRDFTATHEPVIDGKLELGYRVLPYLSVFAGFTYSHADGNDSRRAGRVGDPQGLVGPAGGVYDLYAVAGDYDAYTGRGGFKLTLPRTILNFIHAPKAITPYFSYSAGGKYVEAQDISFYGASTRGIVNSGRGTLYDGTWVFTTEAEFGYEVKVTRHMSITLESGYGYDGKPDHTASRLGTNAAFTGADRGGNRLYSTVSLGGKITF